MLKSPQGAAGGRRAPHRLLDKLVAALAASARAFSLGFAAVAPADSAPPDPASPATPATVTADALPTVQIDGVVWQQVVVGNTVYAAGSFGAARPAGSPAGSNTVVRRNILAYNLTTGELLPFAPALNAQAYSIAASPDGSRIYGGGDYAGRNYFGLWNGAVGTVSSGTGFNDGHWHRVIATLSGGGMFLGIIGRKAGADEYRAKLKISSTGNTTLYRTKLVGGTETTLQSVTVPGLTVAAGDQLRLRMTVTGTAPAALQARVWRDGATEPATWLVTAGDASASLQTAGSVGLMSFLWSTAANAPVQATFDEFNVRLN